MTDGTSRAEKLKIAGIKRFGSEEKWREFLRESASKSRRNHKGNGYFAYLKQNDPEMLRELAKKGGASGTTKKD